MRRWRGKWKQARVVKKQQVVFNRMLYLRLIWQN
jgi:hypothetical protein